jgi:hypothetical protein
VIAAAGSPWYVEVAPYLVALGGFVFAGMTSWRGRRHDRRAWLTDRRIDVYLGLIELAHAFHLVAAHLWPMEPGEEGRREALREVQTLINQIDLAANKVFVVGPDPLVLDVQRYVQVHMPFVEVLATAPVDVRRVTGLEDVAEFKTVSDALARVVEAMRTAVEESL